MDTTMIFAATIAIALYSASRMLVWKGVATQSAPAYWNRQYLKF